MKDHFNVLSKVEFENIQKIRSEVKRKGILISKIRTGQYKEGKFSQHNDLIEQLKNVTPFIKNKEVKNPMPEDRKKKISISNKKAYLEKTKGPRLSNGGSTQQKKVKDPKGKIWNSRAEAGIAWNLHPRDQIGKWIKAGKNGWENV
jgi:hypothetical protein